jgi:hypothetical protein
MGCKAQASATITKAKEKGSLLQEGRRTKKETMKKHKDMVT